MKLSDIWQIKIQRKLHKINIDEDSLFLALTLFIGIGAGALAVFIKKSIEWLAHFAGTLEAPTFLSFTLGTIFILVSGYITTRKAPETSGSGIPQTKIHLVVDHGVIKFKEWILKLVTSILSLSSGITLGTEGPTVAVTAGFASSIASLFSLSKAKIKSLLAVGSAAGIAAAFNTPIAAVTFTLEEIVSNMNTKSLGPIIISSVAAVVTSQMLSGGESTFSVLKYRFEDPKELVFYLLVGLLAAVVGPLWVKTIMQLRKLRITVFKGHRLTYIMTTFFLLMAFATYDFHVLGSGHHIINETLLSNLTSYKTILYLFLIKFVFISLCYSSGISGGLFMPTLFMGGMLGSLVGIAAHQFYSTDIQIGAFALVGMGAYFATVIRAPFTSILIIFEMTQDYKIILPLMIANITAYIISGKMVKGSIYEQISEQDGIHLPSKDDSEALEQLNVGEAMIKDIFSLDHKCSIEQSLHRINKTTITGFPVIRNNRLFGVISKNQIASAFANKQGHLPVSDICTTKDLVTVHPDESLLVAFHYLEKFKISRLLVVSRVNTTRLLGVLTAKEIVEQFGFHIQDESATEKINNIIEEMHLKSDGRDQE